MDKKRRELPFSLEGRTHYDEGYLTPEQVNFIFKFLPVDITYVDENDRVIFIIVEMIEFSKKCWNNWKRG